MGNVLKAVKAHKMHSECPIVVILGCTGTGKSNLAIELAKKFNGEIISADSMQVYKGLDIITNKVTREEQEEAVHHCIDHIDPLSRYTVVDFRNYALPIINKLMKQKKLPIIVGGTNYYIESLLWDVLLNPENGDKRLLFEKDKDKTCFDGTISADDLLYHDISPDSFKNVDSVQLHKLLEEVDPKISNTIHPEDRRKVIRSLQVYQQHGRCHSDILEEQRAQKGGSSLGGPLRFKTATMLWIQCEKEVLKKRLDERVDDMLKRGLISELLDFHKNYNEHRINSENVKYTEGIFQSIGFKEFHDYLILSDEEKSSKKGKRAFEKSIEEMKVSTKQYARKQTKWIENRFLRKPDRQFPSVYGLDGTDITLWKERVVLPAVDIVQSILEDRTPSAEPLPIRTPIIDVKETHYCEVCEKLFVGRRTWEIHISSKKHHKRKSSLQKATVVCTSQESTHKSDT